MRELKPARPAVVAGGGGLVVVLVALAAACSLTVNTKGLTCDTDYCTFVDVVDAAVPDAHVTVDSGAACDASAASLSTDPSNCGSCGHACKTNEVCARSACHTLCSGGIVYVAPTGSDTYDGCSTMYPLQTLGAAIAAVAAVPGAGAKEEIHVCAGSFSETSLTVSSDIVLRGGYNCTTWARTKTYGGPLFDAVNETRVQTKATGGNGATVTFTGAGVTTKSVFDGFTVLGSSTATLGGDSIGIDVTSGAAVAITNSHVSGSKTVATRSIGIQAILLGRPEIGFDMVEGGAGQTSVGIYAYGSGEGTHVHDSDIHGGGGTQGTSAALHIDSSAAMKSAYALSGNTIEGGTGVGSSTMPGSIGVRIDTTDIDVIGNDISGGAPNCSEDCQSFGISSIAHKNNGLLVSGNRVVGSSGTNSGYALYIAQCYAAVVVNNLLYGGTGPASTGLPMYASSGALVANNTIIGARLAMSLSLTPTAVIENNLFLAPVDGAYGIASDDCSTTTPSTVSALKNNAFVGYGGRFLQENVAGCVPDAIDLAGLSTHFGASATDNVRVDADCSGENATTTPRCIALTACATSAAACVAAVAKGSDGSSDGRDTILDESTGWPYQAGVSCALTQGGADLTATVPLDILGTARTVPFSIGAYEDDATCD